MSEKNKARSYRMQIRLLLVAAVVLSNPVVGVLDVLPDVLAWLCCFSALRNFAEIEENMRSARKQAVYLTVISSAKVIAYFPLSASQTRSDLMLFTLLFGALEAVCTVLFFKYFLNGCETISRSADAPLMQERSSDVRFLTMLFAVCRPLFTFLPELTAIPALLTDGSNAPVSEEEFYRYQDLAATRDALIFASAVLMLILGVIWLIKILPFLRLFRTENALSEQLPPRLFADTPERNKRRSLASFHASRVCFALAILLLLDIQVDGIRIIPLWASPLFLAFGCAFLHHKKRSFYVLSAASSVLLLLAEVYLKTNTVWDAVVYSQVSVGSVVCSGVLMTIYFPVLFCVWMGVSEVADGLSDTYGCGRMFLTGLPYVLLVLYAILHTAVFALPPLLDLLSSVQSACVLLLLFIVNRRFAAFEEQMVEALSLSEEEP